LLGAIVELLATSYRAYRLAQPIIGDKLPIIWAGSIRILMTKLFTLAGIKDLAIVDINVNRLKIAEKLGAKYIIDV